MQQPQGFVSKDHPDWVCKLQQSLYGTMQAGHDFWNELDNTYQELGFSRSRADGCVRARIDDGKISITATYMDDITGVADMQEGINQIRKDLSSQYHLSGESEFKYMLRIAIQRDRERGTITLCQKAYAT
jgi:Reverse transcriptase (RNA-dependent DNA polymerase)